MNFVSVGPWNIDGLIIIPDELRKEQSQYVRDLLELGFPAIFTTPEEQTAMLRAVLNGRGLGIFYWDATRTGVPGNGWDPTDPSSGNAWENQVLFDFNHEPLPALDEFRPEINTLF